MATKKQYQDLLAQIATMDIAAIVAACAEVGIQYQTNMFQTDEEARQVASSDVADRIEEELEEEDEDESLGEPGAIRRFFRRAADSVRTWRILAGVGAVVGILLVIALLMANHRANDWQQKYNDEAQAYQELYAQFQQLTQVPEGAVPQVAIEEIPAPVAIEEIPAPVAIEEIPAPVLPPEFVFPAPDEEAPVQPTQPAGSLADIIE